MVQPARYHDTTPARRCTQHLSPVKLKVAMKSHETQYSETLLGLKNLFRHCDACPLVLTATGRRFYGSLLTNTPVNEGSAEKHFISMPKCSKDILKRLLAYFHLL